MESQGRKGEGDAVKAHTPTTLCHVDNNSNVQGTKKEKEVWGRRLGQEFDRVSSEPGSGYRCSPEAQALHAARGSAGLCWAALVLLG